MIDGLLVIDKPSGMTSHDVVARIRKVFSQKRVGHAGTLDPGATGVLLVGLGQVTRLLQYISILSKTYTAEVVLGSSTTTLDAFGEPTGTWDMSTVRLGQARHAAACLTGDIMQIPPMVSALKVGGRRLHQLARAGVTVERQARPVTVHRFDVNGLAAGVLDVEVECSSGTYVRVLADDLGRALGGGAHLRRLRRTAVGPFDDPVPLDVAGHSDVLPPVDALPWLEPVAVAPEVAAAVLHGAVLDLPVSGPGPWRVLSCEGDLLAVYEPYRDGQAKPRVVLSR
jgi:tRNA pseudouridine55 synthase